MRPEQSKKEWLRNFVNEWKDVIASSGVIFSIIIGCVSTSMQREAFVEEQALRRTEREAELLREAQRSIKDEEEKKELQLQRERELRNEVSIVMDRLAGSETRYNHIQLVDGEQSVLQDRYTGNPIGLRTYIDRSNFRERKLCFGLPLISSEENRMTNGEPEVRYRVALAEGGPAPIMIPSPFGCISCGSSDRLETYANAKRLANELNNTLSPSDFVRLGRAAVDLDNESDARRYLNIAYDGSKSEPIPAIRLKIQEEIAKTMLLMKYYEKGDILLNNVIGELSLPVNRDNLQRVPELYYWRAQLAATLADTNKASFCIEQMATYICTYNSTHTRNSSLIQQACGVILGFLLQSGVQNPKLEVPDLYMVYVPNKGWQQASILIKNKKYGDPLPSPLEWD